jgi:arsenate reductase-like glutaredoxin family protein
MCNLGCYILELLIEKELVKLMENPNMDEQPVICSAGRRIF